MEKEKENGHKKVFAPFIPTIPKEKKKEIIPTNGRKPGGKIIPTQENPTMSKFSSLEQVFEKYMHGASKWGSTMQYAKAYHTF